MLKESVSDLRISIAHRLGAKAFQAISGGKVLRKSSIYMSHSCDLVCKTLIYILSKEINCIWPEKIEFRGLCLPTNPERYATFPYSCEPRDFDMQASSTCSSLQYT